MTIARAVRQAYLRSRVREALPDSTKIALRRGWVRLARRAGYPISSQLVARPPLLAGRRPFRLTRVLLACDLNADYLDFWPLVSRAWSEVVGLEPTLVLVADDVPDALRDDPRVVGFRPVEGLHTAFQAQCIRLLYPALLEGDGAVLVSDMELIPLDPRYFHGPVARLDARFFVTFRDVHHPRREVAIGYNAAEPATWRDLNGVRDDEGVRARLGEWHAGIDYEGVRGGDGWYTDQHVLYRLVTSWPDASRRFWMLDDDYTGHRRLERDAVEAAGAIRDDVRADLLRRRYADFNALVPHSRFRALNEHVLELALEAGRRRA